MFIPHFGSSPRSLARIPALPALPALLGLALAACASSPSAASATSPSSAQVASAPSVDGPLRAALAGSARTEAERARDVYRHPRETLEFFGLRDDMNVVELWAPGGTTRRSSRRSCAITASSR